MSLREIGVYTAGSAKDLGNTKSNWRKTLPDIKGVRWLNPALAPEGKNFPFAFPRDIIQLQEAKVVLAIFNKGRVQRGTASECGIAWALDKVLIIVSDSEENDNELRYILGFATAKVRSLEEALEIITFMAKGFI